ncbi:MAG: STN and carboxypeptidase regulatory-like domain-containing protein [Bacteroidota bacterium]
MKILLSQYRTYYHFALILIAFQAFVAEETIAQELLSTRIDLNIEDKTIDEVLKFIQSNYTIRFSYSKNLVKVDKKVSIYSENEPLFKVLNQLFEDQKINIKQRSGIIILQKKPQNYNKIIIRGKVKSIGDSIIEYASVKLESAKIGVMTDHKGNFKMIVGKEDLSDSIIISSMGYEEKTIKVTPFVNKGEHVVYLKRKFFVIPEIPVKAKDFIKQKLGNLKRISFGSMYIDTHGQQTALFVKNKKSLDGKLISVKYFLSRKGNTYSPFRVRIYKIDNNTGGPGNDLTKEIIVVKPDFKGGWFRVDLSAYEITVPKEGFFVAIEGVYPNLKSQQMTISKRSFRNIISYGQRLGYNKKRGKNTWHYSLTHTWFQLSEQNYNVMIAAEVLTHKKR